MKAPEHSTTGQRAAAGLAAVIDAQRQILCSLLDPEETGGKATKPERIHDLRVAIRRLSTTLELAAALGYEARPRSVKRLRKLLAGVAPARDLHVQLRTLAKLSAEPDEATLGLLRRRRRRASVVAAKELAAFDVTGFGRDISFVTGALSAVDTTPQSRAVAGAALIGELARRHLIVERGRRGASAQDVRGLHRTRLALKGYRYALEALRALLPRDPRPLLDACARLQDQLGDAHDVHVLAESLRELAVEESSKRMQRLARELQRRSELAHREAARALTAARLSWPFAPDDVGPE